jgi:hypothetical protein
VAYLVSKEPGYVTGSGLRIDGGFSAWGGASTFAPDSTHQAQPNRDDLTVR